MQLITFLQGLWYPITEHQQLCTWRDRQVYEWLDPSHYIYDEKWPKIKNHNLTHHI